MQDNFNYEKVQEATKMLLEAMGQDVNRPGLVETPRRVAGYWQELLEGEKYTNQEIADMYNKSFIVPSDSIVVMQVNDVFSHCEHHLALMYNMKVSVAYIPKEKIIGLSKIARIADMVGKRLQLQERIGSDISEIVSMITETKDVAVLITGEHSCMTARGIKKPGTLTTTTTFTGKFEEDSMLRQEAILLMRD